jgi:hypothetical protein
MGYTLPFLFSRNSCHTIKITRCCILHQFVWDRLRKSVDWNDDSSFLNQQAFSVLKKVLQPQRDMHSSPFNENIQSSYCVHSSDLYFGYSKSVTTILSFINTRRNEHVDG